MNNTTKKIIEVKSNKRMRQKIKKNIIEQIMLLFTITALYFLINSFLAIIELQYITDFHLISGIISLAWLGLFALYLFITSD